MILKYRFLPMILKYRDQIASQRIVQPAYCEQNLFLKIFQRLFGSINNDLNGDFGPFRLQRTLLFILNVNHFFLICKFEY